MCLGTVNFLEVTFDLDNNLYKLYREPTNKPIYVNKHCNRLPNVLRQLPKFIAKRISDTSSSKDLFDKSILILQNAFFESSLKLKYTPSDKNLKEGNS